MLYIFQYIFVQINMTFQTFVRLTINGNYLVFWPRERIFQYDAKARGVPGSSGAAAWRRRGGSCRKTKTAVAMVTPGTRLHGNRTKAAVGTPGFRVVGSPALPVTGHINTGSSLGAIGNKTDIVARSSCLFSNFFM